MKQIYFIILLFFAIASGAVAQTTNIDTLTQNAKAGDAKAQNDLGDAYYEGKGVTKDFYKAFIWYQKAAEQGYAVAQTHLGYCYAVGKGITTNLAEAVKWYTKAAEQGYVLAQQALGYLYYQDQNFTEAVKWYTKAANQGNAEAQYKLAGCYGEGKGVTQNGVQSMNWYIKAAKNGHPRAAGVYGANLLYGKPQFHVQRNAAEAVKYLRIAADHNDEDAIQILVGYYTNAMKGEKSYGVEKYLSYDDFVEYLKQGAELGNEDMQTILSGLPTLKLMLTQEKELVAKYGQKAYDNIQKGNVYVGMPEGILTAYRTIEDDGSRYQMYKYNGPYRDRVGTYKQYIPNSLFQMVNSLGKVFPKIVKVRNGKVTNVVY